MGGLERGMLLLFDLGFLNFGRCDQLTATGVWFLTRKETRTVTHTGRVLRKTATLHDQIVRLGAKADRQCAHPVRLVEWLHQGKGLVSFHGGPSSGQGGRPSRLPCCGRQGARNAQARAQKPHRNHRSALLDNSRPTLTCEQCP